MPPQSDPDDELQRLRERRRRELTREETTPAAPAEPVTLDASEVDAFVVEHDLVLLDLWAPWCGPARSWAPSSRTWRARSRTWRWGR